MKAAACIILYAALVLPVLSFSQQHKYKEIDLDGNEHLITSIELSPDQKTLAIATAKGPLLLWDIEAAKVVRKIDVSSFAWGAYLNYSRNGRYLLMQQQYFTDWALNKDRPAQAAVLDIASGQVVISKDRTHSAALTPDSKSLVALQGNEIVIWDIASGNEERRFKPVDVTNALAVSPDGKYIAVSQKATQEDLKMCLPFATIRKRLKKPLSSARWWRFMMLRPSKSCWW